MAWHNPPIPWREVNRLLSGEPGNPGDGNDSPAWTRVREDYVPPKLERPAGPVVPYAELHAHSCYSFLDGASHPHELAFEGARLGLQALALTDHDGLYGVVRFSEAAKTLDVATVFGAEISLDLPGPQSGEPDPVGRHLLLLARNPTGYQRLSRAISEGHFAGAEKGRPVYDLEQIAATGDGNFLVLTGCRKGTVPTALTESGPEAALAELDRLVALFGRDNVAVELTRHGDPFDDERCDALAAVADRAGLPVVATGGVHYADPSRARLAAALAAVRARRSLDEIDPWLPAGPVAHLRSGAEMTRLFQRYPSAVPTAARLGAECAFDLKLVAPDLPAFPVPPGHTEATYLRELVWEGAAKRYGSRGSAHNSKAYARLDYELEMIEDLGFPGYFLIVWEIAKYCHDNGILCQGRGSAVTSAVCYALRITTADAVAYNLLFERFLSPAREESYPDIDLDISSARREEVIQHVYKRYGRQYTAQVANVITYRLRSAVRDMARALGHSVGQQDAWSKQVDRWGDAAELGDHDIPAEVLALAKQVTDFPRHLGIHSGGMVICDRPVIDVCPVEFARMQDRTVLQWDKDDCARTGLVKFDLLGLGMLTALQHTRDLVAEHHGRELDLGKIPPEESAVYDMLCTGDSIGVFQVESRAQMATLPRMKPRTFYDLVVEVALIRPGPIQGGSVHPYLRRRNNEEDRTPPHSRLTKTLERTLGVPLFQEQLMEMAIELAGFTAAKADGLRRAMSSKRSVKRMAEYEQQILAGMAEKGVEPDVARSLYQKLIAFASYGFPESHAISFAQLVYSSSWFKLYYPAAFCAGLLRSQPMGFYSPQSLVADARRHGVTVHGPDVNLGPAIAGLEPVRPGETEQAVRLGLDSVRHIGTDVATRIEDERRAHGPYADLPDLARRAELSVAQLEALATAGATESMGLSRREALWGAGALGGEGPGRLPGMTIGVRSPTLPGMTDVEETMADLWATGVTPAGYPTELLRTQLTARGIRTAADLQTVKENRCYWVAGIVTHRQRPATAGGITFINLEDETGLINVICGGKVWASHRRVAHSAAALLIYGALERKDSVVNLLALRIERLDLPVPARSRDFR